MINILDIKKGMTFIYNKQIYLMIDSSHHKMGRGKAIVKCKIHNILSDNNILVTFSSNEKFEQAYIETLSFQYLYFNDDLYTFMNTENYDQIELKEKDIKNDRFYLVTGEIYKIQLYKNSFIKMLLPEKIRLMVVETEENVNPGNTETSARKSATLESRLVIKVPLFIKNKEFILVSSETGKYISKY